jgi:hypothetical protein
LNFIWLFMDWIFLICQPFKICCRYHRLPSKPR